MGMPGTHRYVGAPRDRFCRSAARLSSYRRASGRLALWPRQLAALRRANRRHLPAAPDKCSYGEGRARLRRRIGPSLGRLRPRSRPRLSKGIDVAWENVGSGGRYSKRSASSGSTISAAW